ncbi:MAG: PD-(D/E)XK nuclease family protein [Saccharofermentans sp.]|nr:PD-(D/E)XK nuclease family protein [Saccharofermentans sp.]
MINLHRYNGTGCITRGIIEETFRCSAEDNKETIFIAPEFAKAQVEREVIDYLASRGGGNASVIASLTNGDILSFHRLARSILDCCGRSNAGSGSDIELRNAIYAAFVRRKGEFKTFGKLATRFEYINTIIALLGDFSRYGIGPDELDEAIKSAGDAPDEYVNKLCDIKLLMSEIEQINSEYGLLLLTDPIAVASDITEEILKDTSKLNLRRYRQLKQFINCRYAFIGFGNNRLFTPQELRLVKNLSDLGAVLDFYPISTGNDKTDMTSPFYKCGGEFAARLMQDGSSDKGFACDTGVNCNLRKIVEAFATDRQIENFACDDNIKLSEFVGVDDRICYVFNEIINLTHGKDAYRYKDIRVVCCDEDLMARLRGCARKYGLEIFVDKKIELAGTVVPMFIRLILEMPLRGYPLEFILKAMRCGMLNISPRIADGFDNYCRAFNIVDVSRIFNENSYLTETDERKFKIADDKGDMVFAGEYIATNVLPKLQELRQICEDVNDAPTIASKADLLLDFLAVESRQEYLKALVKEYDNKQDHSEAVALKSGYQEMVSLLTVFRHEMNDVEISQKAFLSLVRIDMRNRIEGTIPLKVDSIEITTPEHAFTTPCKVMFILGATRDNFPYKRYTEGLLSNNELKRLTESSEAIKLPDRAELKSREEFVSCCQMLGCVTDRIYMCSEFGKAYSRVYEYLMRFVTPSKVPVNTFTNPSIGTPVKAIHDYKNAAIDREDMDKFLVFRANNAGGDAEQIKGLSVSVSAIENYNTCPFNYMLRKVLKIDERLDRTQIRVNDFGTYVHSVLEYAVKKLAPSGADFDEFAKNAKLIIDSEDNKDALVEEAYLFALKDNDIPGILNEEKTAASRGFESTVGVKIKRMTSFMLGDILADCIDKGYLPTGFEQQIGSPDTNPPLVDLNYIANGKQIRFNGFIDRYDVREEDGIKHLRIEDYKSGDKKVTMKHFLAGIQIQLPVYAHALNLGIKSSAIDDYGYTLVGIKTPKDGEELKCEPVNAGYSPSQIATAMQYSDLIVRESVDNIIEGKAEAVTAIAKTSKCSYCPFAGACGNIPSDPVFKAAPDLTEDITKAEQDQKDIKAADYTPYGRKWNKAEAGAFIYMRRRMNGDK